MRQLNLYGFRKIKCDKGFDEFKHPLFFEGCTKNLKSIKRQLIPQKSSHSFGKNPTKEASQLVHEIDNLKKSISHKQQEQKQLQSWINIKESELSFTNYCARKNFSELTSLIYFFSTNEDPHLFPIVSETTKEAGIWSSNDICKNFPTENFECVSENLCNKIVTDSKFTETLVKQVDKKWTEIKVKTSAKDFVSKSGDNFEKSDDPLRMSFLSITPIGTPLNKSRDPNLFLASKRQKLGFEYNIFEDETNAYNDCDLGKLKPGFNLNRLLNKKFSHDELSDYPFPTGSMTKKSKSCPFGVESSEL